MIKKLDKLVPKPLQHSLSRFSESAIWTFGWKSSWKRARYCLWHAHGAGGDAHSRTDCEAELAENAEFRAVFRLWELLKTGPLKGHVLLRAYANSHSYGSEGYPHRDSEDSRNYWTTVYFAHRDWHYSWGGELVFFNQQYSEIVQAIIPRPGRLVLFSGHTPHCARGVSRECPILRTSIVLKTRKSERRYQPSSQPRSTRRLKQSIRG